MDAIERLVARIRASLLREFMRDVDAQGFGDWPGTAVAATAKRAIIPALLMIALLAGGAAAVGAQAPEAGLTIVIDPATAGPTISRDLFGQFAEQLGEGVYGGIWVGRDSRIPNVRGIRSDVVEALRALQVPVVRWPGGCFAEHYHWRDGVGPAEARKSTVNMWGNVVETNAFGTDEFMDFVGQIGSEAYIAVNVGSGSPGEASDWLEYLTTDLPTTLGRLRAANGHPAPYHLKYLGLGNESWGCGGGMKAATYVEHMKRYATFARNLNPSQQGPWPMLRGPDSVQRVAVGPDAGNTEYTEAVMQAWTERIPYAWGIEGLSMHLYTSGGDFMTKSSTDFGESDYALILRETLGMDALIARHAAIMDRYDPKKEMSLVVDEWGVWLQPLPGTNPGFLRQQNSLRDAIAASLNLNIFARHADRVRMTNIAQMVNVIQSMILTDGARMLLTPTYHVYRMYVPFHDARLLAMSFEPGEYASGDIRLPRIDAIAARAADGSVWLAITNLDPQRGAAVSVSERGATLRSAAGSMLTAERVDSVNTFQAPRSVVPGPIAARASGTGIVLHVAPKSVTVVKLQ